MSSESENNDEDNPGISPQPFGYTPITRAEEQMQVDIICVNRARACSTQEATQEARMIQSSIKDFEKNGNCIQSPKAVY